MLLAPLCAANIGESLPSLQPLSTELRRVLRRPATYRRTLDDQLERMEYKHPNRPPLSLCQSESDSAAKCANKLHVRHPLHISISQLLTRAFVQTLS